MNPHLLLPAGALGALLLTSCDNTRWVERRMPTTPDEHAAIAAHVEAIIPNMPSHVSGDDQDWEDVIEAAHREARESLCRPTLWERRGHLSGPIYTGRWRYLDQPLHPSTD